MKKAFTMLELVFVIVIIGILSVVAMPSFNRDTLQEAANQVVSHIRYTQHLAMMDDKFDSNDPVWFKERWQLKFHKTVDSSLEWSYSIFSDKSKTGNPDLAEVAKNPINNKKLLTGGFSGYVVPVDNERATKKMALYNAYGIRDVKFSGCGNSARRIAFDYLGRPIIGDISNASVSRAYMSGVQKGSLLRTQCVIKLCTASHCSSANDKEVIHIAIEPETGYTHIL